MSAPSETPSDLDGAPDLQVVLAERDALRRQLEQAIDRHRRSDDWTVTVMKRLCAAAGVDLDYMEEWSIEDMEDAIREQVAPATSEAPHVGSDCARSLQRRMDAVPEHQPQSTEYIPGGLGVDPKTGETWPLVESEAPKDDGPVIFGPPPSENAPKIMGPPTTGNGGGLRWPLRPAPQDDDGPPREFDVVKDCLGLAWLLEPQGPIEGDQPLYWCWRSDGPGRVVVTDHVTIIRRRVTDAEVAMRLLRGEDA